MTKLYSVNSQLHKVTGIEKVMMDIHHAVKDCYDAKIVGTKSFEQVNKNHGIEREEYIQFRNPFLFKDSIIIIHERKLLFPFWILNTFLFLNIKIVYVHHNLFHNLKFLSIMPNNVVAIADRGIENLTDYFGVPTRNIHKIHNCVMDIKPPKHKSRNEDCISILYPARINDVKRQIEIVNNLKGKLDKRIRILFAGVGPLFEEFKELTEHSEQFVCLGFRDDIYTLLQDCDFMMLFSKHEGLPITLIEAAMCGTPIVCNDVGGNTEIAINGENAFVANDWKELTKTLNGLINLDGSTYIKMSQNSRKIYEERYSFERFKQDYITLLKNIK